MKNWICKAAALTLALAVLFGLAAAATYNENAELLPLPEANKGRYVDITVDKNPMVKPRSGYYKFNSGAKSPYGYANPSITVNIGTGRWEKTDFMYARVKIASPFQLRMATAEEKLSKKTTVLGSLLAKRAKAVIAINGVLEADVTGDSDWAFMDGPVMHQGVWKRPTAETSEAKLERWKAEDGSDTLVINDEGDLIVLEEATWGEIYQQILDMGEHAVNVFSFGPALVVDGEPRYGYENRQMSTGRLAQRIALCQTGPLEYLIVYSEGPEDEDKAGLKLDEFIELIVTNFPDVKTAYNLDGGSSTTLVFRKGSELWAKVNGKTGKKRGLRDIIYFADAWIPNK